jgi:uncharacterized protein
MRSLKKYSEAQIAPYEMAVAAAALLHDIGHVAPGSHLAERVWSIDGRAEHEAVSRRVILQDSEINSILCKRDPKLPRLVSDILDESSVLPPWTHSIISGGGWNADRGNWAIVDSAMCSVSYGRYNVAALIDAFRLTADGKLVLHESRLDALTHFFVARDSMYRQVYQHRVLQTIDALTDRIVRRLRDLSAEKPLAQQGVYCDKTLQSLLSSTDYSLELELEIIFNITESWWRYHIEQWCSGSDEILADLASRLRDRRLFKTVRLDAEASFDEENNLLKSIEKSAMQLGYDPRYYVVPVMERDTHRGRREAPPIVLRENGAVLPVDEIEPLIAHLLEPAAMPRKWVAIPKEVKDLVGRIR